MCLPCIPTGMRLPYFHCYCGCGCAEVKEEEKLKMLENYKRALQNELEIVDERLSELKKQK